ncbi:MAG TPA: tetratricopeptide repeat protein, partial [Oculatellaceae cyanobacterium]
MTKNTRSLATVALAAWLAASNTPGWSLTPPAYDAYRQAQQAELRGDLPQAEAALRRAIALDPTDYLNYVKLASILNQQGKPNEAILYYQKALSLNPQDTMILYSLGSVYEQVGQYAKAEEAYALTLQNNPRFRFGLLNLARTEIQQKKYEPAIA